jgi:hypothetical protein
LHRFFVFKVRNFKYWLFAYFLISFNCAKFQENWTTFYKGPPFEFFVDYKIKKHQRAFSTSDTRRLLGPQLSSIEQNAPADSNSEGMPCPNKYYTARVCTA